MRKFLLLSILWFTISISAQTNWSLEEMKIMPEPVTNNAVCEGFTYGQIGFNEFIFDRFVFSFGGIDSTLSYTGIHNKSWRYDSDSNVWQQIADIPGSEKTIASSASFVKGKIYIIGGYTVASNGNEVSSSKIHIYDVANDTFLSDGPLIPMPIDDHVQCVYKDSLIFIVTGWSNTGNVPTVQVYDVYTNTWQIASSVLNTTDFRVFGSNGTIVGDTLYYYGGANTNANFPATQKVKKGYINPLDPTDISWSIADYSLPNAYRMACTSVNDTVFWIGGSNISYNYNAVAYDGSGLVSPSNQIVQYSPSGNTETDNTTLELPMDIRGIASVSHKVKYLCGGISTNGKVSNKLLKLTWRKDFSNPIKTINKQKIYFANPVENNKIIFSEIIESVQILNVKGQLVYENDTLNQSRIDVSILEKGFYFMKINENHFVKVLIR